MSHDDFHFEPVPGLPEALPKGEFILWQGRPTTWGLAREAFALYWVAAYFGVLAIWRVGVSSTLLPMSQALPHAIPFLVIGAVVCLLILAMAAVQARSALYTLTNKRVAMRIGAAMTMTLNLPYVQIANAELATRANGSGTLVFELMGDTRLSYFMTWPHLRPWRMAKTQPALRAIPDAAKVAALFADAAEARLNEPKLTTAPTHAPVAAE